MEEIWKEIPDSDGYFVSNLGRVRNSDTVSHNCLTGGVSVRKAVILKPTYSFGYQYVGIRYMNGKVKRKRIHRLVAEAFIQNPSGFQYVNHLDGVKTNNCVDNLEWCDASRNTQHAYDTGLIDKDKFRSVNSSQSTPYMLVDENGVAQYFGSQKELLQYLEVGKTVFKSQHYQEHLRENGYVCSKISKQEYFALEGSTTILE